MVAVQRQDPATAAVEVVHVRRVRGERKRGAAVEDVGVLLSGIDLAGPMRPPQVGARGVQQSGVRDHPLPVEGSVGDADWLGARSAFFLEGVGLGRLAGERWWHLSEVGVTGLLEQFCLLVGGR